MGSLPQARESPASDAKYHECARVVGDVPYHLLKSTEIGRPSNRSDEAWNRDGVRTFSTVHGKSDMSVKLLSEDRWRNHYRRGPGARIDKRFSNSGSRNSQLSAPQVDRRMDVWFGEATRNSTPKMRQRVF